jgi:hypothetical protein
LSVNGKKEEKMKVRKDRKLLRHALAQGIRTAAEMAAWLRTLDRGKGTPLGAVA